MIKEFIRRFKVNLDMALMEKTNWGRNDLKLVIEKTISDTLSEMLG
jgi:hypothetical protein